MLEQARERDVARKAPDLLTLCYVTPNHHTHTQHTQMPAPAVTAGKNDAAHLQRELIAAKVVLLLFLPLEITAEVLAAMLCWWLKPDDDAAAFNNFDPDVMQVRAQGLAWLGVDGPPSSLHMAMQPMGCREEGAAVFGLQPGMRCPATPQSAALACPPPTTLPAPPLLRSAPSP